MSRLLRSVKVNQWKHNSSQKPQNPPPLETEARWQHRKTDDDSWPQRLVRRSDVKTKHRLTWDDTVYHVMLRNAMWRGICYVWFDLIQCHVTNCFLSQLSSHRPDREESTVVGIMASMAPPPKPTKAIDTDGKARARGIDKIARKSFPLAFILFNIVYWVGYTHE